jgi:hypothetical protein
MLTVAAFVAVAVSSCSASDHGPKGYERLGSVDGATVYGQRNAPYVSILVTRGGATLCNSRGAIGPTRALAICNDLTDRADVYAIPVAKSADSTDLSVCSANDGQQWALTRLSTPGDWESDIAVRIDTSDVGPYVSCG